MSSPIAQEVVSAAFREGNLIPIGRGPTVGEMWEGVSRLSTYLLSLLGSDIGEFAMDWPVPPVRTAPVSARWPLSPLDESMPADVWPYLPNNVRVLTTLAAPATVWLPWLPSDGSRIEHANLGTTATTLTIDGNGRRIEGAATLTFDPLVRPANLWFYRGDLGNWLRVLPLAQPTDTCYLPSTYFDLLACGLSVRISSRFGQEPRAITVRTEREQMQRLRAQYRQHMPVGGGFSPLMMSRQAHPNAYFGGGALPT